jgi:hypothetical protein
MKRLAKHGIPMQMLVNDFRAGVAMKEEQGLREYVTIETVQDIDAVAQMGDSVIIDSNEDDHGRLVKYVSDFRQVWRFAHDEEDRSVHGEVLFRPECEQADCEEAVIIDDHYFRTHPKEERTVLFLRDHDHQKILLNNDAFFQSFEMELLLGHYFFVKYEDDLAKRFLVLHEPEEYMEIISGSTTLVTASSQAALEARASGTKVVFLKLEGEVPLYSSQLLQRYGVEIVEGLDAEAVRKALARATSKKPEELTMFDESGLLKNL